MAQDLESMVFGNIFGRKKEIDKDISITRREFMRGLGAAGLGAAYLSLPEYAKASVYDEGENLPPLFREDLCTDYYLKECFKVLKEGGDSIAGKPIWMILNRDTSVTNIHNGDTSHIVISGATPFVHPAYWVTRKTYDLEVAQKGRTSIKEEELSQIRDKAKNFHLYHFANGVDNFYNQFVINGLVDEGKAEENLLKSILYAAYADPHVPQTIELAESEAQKYLTSDLRGRTLIANQAMNKLNNLVWSPSQLDLSVPGGKTFHDWEDLNKIGNNDSYRLLTAQAGAYFLTTFYEGDEKKGKAWSRNEAGKNQINNTENSFWNLEFPLSKRMKNYIRGPPDYWT